MNNRDFFIISLLTFITVLVWIFFDAYHVFSTSTIPPDLKMQLLPLDPKIPLDQIQNLKNRPELFPIISSSSAFPTAGPTTSSTITH